MSGSLYLTVKNRWSSLLSSIGDLVIPPQWPQAAKSPICHAPRFFKKMVRWDYLGQDLFEALRLGAAAPQNRKRALDLAAQGASAWYSWGDVSSPTTLQLAVSLGWCDVARELLGNDRHWFWRTPLGKALRLQHLASLWLFVDTQEAESFLLAVSPLESAHHYLRRPPTTLYRLAESMGERGLLRSFGWAHDHLPPMLREALVNDIDLSRWSLRGILCLIERNPKLLSRVSHHRHPLIHLVASSVEGQDLLRKMGVLSLPLDSNGNNALLAWCLAAYRWNPGVVSRASYGTPENSMIVLPDCRAQAEASLAGLIRLVSDPYQKNHDGKTAWEQSEMESGVDVWVGLRASRKEDRAWRVQFLQSHLEALQIESSTPNAHAIACAPRL